MNEAIFPFFIKGRIQKSNLKERNPQHQKSMKI